MKTLIIMLIAAASVEAQIYVAPGGDDRNPGTSDRPVATLERARDLARQGSIHATNDTTIYLAGGTYRLTKPLLLNDTDSGKNGHRIVYTAIRGEHPVFSGAVRITNWKLVDRARNLWSAPAPEALKNTRQLYVNGVRAFRTHARLSVQLTQTDSGYVASDQSLASWKNPRDVEFVYTGGNAVWSEPSVGLGSWTQPRCMIASIHGKEIVMSQPCWNNSTRRVTLPEWKRTANLVGPARVGKQPSYVENAFELLGRPGEWYFDRSARLIYYVPRKGEDLARADVEAPVLEALVSGTGTGSRPIHDITFSGIQFSYATWLTPSSSEGLSEIQANYTVTGAEGYATQGLCDIVPKGTCPYGNWTKASGNVAFSYSHRISFVRDVFTHLGAAGLDLGDGSQSDLIEGCVFTDISGNGLQLGGVDQPLAAPAAYTSDNRISNNHIYSIGAEFRGGIGIVVGYARNTRIEHNQLDHLPYAAMSIGWGGWPDKIRRAGQANYSENNIISNNLIFDFMLVLSDGGGIYTQGLTGPSLAAGEKVTENVVRDQFSTGHAIYSDNGSCNMTVSANVIFNTNFDNWGSRHKDYYDGQKGTADDPLLIKDNYWEQGDLDSNELNVTEEGNRLIDALTQVPQSILNHAGLRPEFKDLLHLVVASQTAPEPPSRVAAAAGNGSAYVTWSPPVYIGGDPVKTYTVIASNGAKASISSVDFARKAYVQMPSLPPGRYTFTVTAANSHGDSVESLPSLPIDNSAAEVNLPARPSYVKALPGVRMASIHFKAPEPVGTPILAYAVTVNPGGRKVTFRGRREMTLEGRHTTFDVVNGLQSGRSYTFSVAAIGPAGEGPSVTTDPVTIR